MRSTSGSVLLVLVLAGTSSCLFAQCNTCPERRSITVTGTGKVSADADLAIVRVGYKLYGLDAKSAYASATEASNAIMKALTESGIPKDSIESTSQVLQPTPQYELQQFLPVTSDGWRNRQFTTTQSWIIRVKPDEAAKALNTAIDAGANESGWIEWIIQNPSALQSEAAAKAVGNARMLAEQIAQKSNVRLGNLMSVSENPNGPPYGGPMNGAVDRIEMGVGVISGVQMGNQPLAINSRRVEFSSSIYASFAIE